MAVVYVVTAPKSIDPAGDKPNGVVPALGGEGARGDAKPTNYLAAGVFGDVEGDPHCSVSSYNETGAVSVSVPEEESMLPGG